jgi:hypothetical protein
MINFLTVSRSTAPRAIARGFRYVVTAEYADGYEVLSYHKIKAEAFAALQRYEAADARGEAVS